MGLNGWGALSDIDRLHITISGNLKRLIKRLLLMLFCVRSVSLTHETAVFIIANVVERLNCSSTTNVNYALSNLVGQLNPLLHRFIDG